MIIPVWVANDYSVTTNFVKLGPDVLPDATHASDYSFTITVDQGYILPSVIEIISGTTELIKDVDYTYNSSTGEVEIFGPSIVGAISITSSGLAKNYDVVLNGVNLDATAIDPSLIIVSYSLVT